MADFNINITAKVKDGENIVGEAVAKGDLVYLSGDGKYYKANASSTITSSTEVRMALETAVADQQIEMLTYGYFEYTAPTVLIPGVKYYVSQDPGKVTSQVYGSSGNVVRYVGTALNSTTLLFNPDQTYIHDNGRKVNEVELNLNHPMMP